MVIPATGPFQFDPGGGGPEDDFSFMPGAISPKDAYEIEQSTGRAVSVVTIVAPKAPAPPAAKLSIDNILDRARERLVDLKTELAAMAELQREHDKLERLLAAADALDS